MDSCQAKQVENVSIVVTHYRTPELLRACLVRLNAHAPDCQVVVVDTSSDGEPLPEEVSRVHLLKVPNHSMANAVNAGLKMATGELILQMNADVMLNADTLPALVEQIKMPQVGMVGPSCRTPSGDWQNQGLLYHPYYAYLELTGRSSVRVPWLSGCCQLIRRDVLEQVGGLDSSFRFYNEDMEWCWRLREADYHCKLVATEVLHVGGASTPPEDARFLLEGFRGGMVLSQCYKPRWYRLAHHWTMRLYATLKSKFAEDAATRKLYTDIARMFAAERFAESPFGETLNEDNPEFGRGWLEASPTAPER